MRSFIEFEVALHASSSREHTWTPFDCAALLVFVATGIYLEQRPFLCTHVARYNGADARGRDSIEPARRTICEDIAAIN